MRESDRAKTIFEKSHDKQIGEDLHDQILIWLMDEIKNENVDIISAITGRFTFDKVETKIEFPFYKAHYHGQSIIGFADLAVTAHWKRFYTETEIQQVEKDNPYSCWAKEMRKEKFEHKSAMGFVEIKSRVNIGETLRQVEYYKQSGHLSHSRWAVCAPPFAQFEILEEQGVKFIAYEPIGDFY